jgi:hypothetical protein
MVQSNSNGSRTGKETGQLKQLSSPDSHHFSRGGKTRGPRMFVLVPGIPFVPESSLGNYAKGYIPLDVVIVPAIIIGS